MFPIARTNGSLPLSLETPVNRLSTLFDRFLNDEFFSPMSTDGSARMTAAPLSMWEDEDHLFVEIDAPGMTERDIDVSIHAGELCVRGERKCGRRGEGYDSRSYGRFEQRISLPSWANADTVEAKLTNGVLALTFPKGADAKPRRIPLKTDASTDSPAAGSSQ